MDLVFVHIPKTAGTALREALFEARKDTVTLCDYGRDSALTHPIILRHLLSPEGSARRLRAALGYERPITLSGHIKADRYVKSFGPASLVTFMRDPVARVVSAYLHMSRNGSYTGSLIDFVEQPRHRDVQAAHIGATPLRDFLFVGLQEGFEQDVAALGRRIEAPLNVQRLNAAPRDQAGFRVSLAMRRHIRACNRLDQELYEQALDLRERRQGRRRSLTVRTITAALRGLTG